MKKLGGRTFCWLCAVIAGFLFLLNACTTDFDVNAPYDDIPVVYGLLNQAEDLHFIRINKTFLGEGNAILMATEPDSSIYQNMSATVEEYLGGIYQRTFTLTDTLIPDREPGPFYYPESKMYYFQANDLNEDAEYRLNVNIDEGRKEAGATTTLVKDFSYHALTGNPLFTVDMHNGSSYMTYGVRWNSAEGGSRYEGRLFFTYFDVTATDTVRRDNEWQLGEVFNTSLDGVTAMELTASGESFYDILEDWVNQNDADDPAPGGPVLKRILGDFTINVAVAGEELDTYMQINEPVTGIVQERPSYTNIWGGIGLFGSRYQKSVYNKKMGLNSFKFLCEGDFASNNFNFCVDTPITVWSLLSFGCHCQDF